jgi:hypothetical protein
VGACLLERCSNLALVRTGRGQKNSLANAAFSRWLRDRNWFGGARRLRRSAISARPGRTRCRADCTPVLGDGWRRGGGLAVVAALAVYAVRGAKMAKEERLAKFLIIGGGAVVPTVILAVVLVYGLAMMPGLLARAPEGSLRLR